MLPIELSEETNRGDHGGVKERIHELCQAGDERTLRAELAGLSGHDLVQALIALAREPQAPPAVLREVLTRWQSEAALRTRPEVPTDGLPRPDLPPEVLFESAELDETAALPRPAKQQERAQLGPYRLERELARGGMGVVFLARHEATGARYALKTILTGEDGREDEGDLRERFRREAELCARLTHPHVVRVHSASLEGERPYLVQELLHGGTLAERLERSGPLPLEEAVELGLALAGALEHAHAHGVLHRDLKPDNVLYDQHGVPRLSDFGLAFGLEESALRLTASRAILGTPIYIAPEQLHGEGRNEPPVDAYGLGALLYHALTGEPPVNGHSLQELLGAVLLRVPLPLRRLRPDAPPALEALLAELLSKDPQDRPSLGEVRERLQSGWSRGRPQLQRGALLLGALVGLALLVAGAFELRRARQEEARLALRAWLVRCETPAALLGHEPLPAPPLAALAQARAPALAARVRAFAALRRARQGEAVEEIGDPLLDALLQLERGDRARAARALAGLPDSPLVRVLRVRIAELKPALDAWAALGPEERAELAPLLRERVGAQLVALLSDPERLLAEGAALGELLGRAGELGLAESWRAPCERGCASAAPELAAQVLSTPPALVALGQLLRAAGVAGLPPPVVEALHQRLHQALPSEGFPSLPDLRAFLSLSGRLSLELGPGACLPADGLSGAFGEYARDALFGEAGPAVDLDLLVGALSLAWPLELLEVIRPLAKRIEAYARRYPESLALRSMLFLLAAPDLTQPHAPPSPSEVEDMRARLRDTRAAGQLSPRIRAQLHALIAGYDAWRTQHDTPERASWAARALEHARLAIEGLPPRWNRPAVFLAWHAQALARRATGEDPHGVQTYAAALRQLDFDLLRLALAEAQREAGQRAEALRLALSMRERLRVDPVPSRIGRTARLLRLLDERASAHELLDEHRARWLGDPLLCAEAARSLVARERSSEARQLLQAGARTYPDSPHLRDPDLGED